MWMPSMIFSLIWGTENVKDSHRAGEAPGTRASLHEGIGMHHHSTTAKWVAFMISVLICGTGNLPILRNHVFDHWRRRMHGRTDGLVRCCGHFTVVDPTHANLHVLVHVRCTLEGHVIGLRGGDSVDVEQNGAQRRSLLSGCYVVRVDAMLVPFLTSALLRSTMGAFNMRHGTSRRWGLH